MNREIKFRAWLAKDRRFYAWGVGDIEGAGSFFTGPPSDATVLHQQFTGLKDKNGIEIYEGDVIEITHPREGKSRYVMAFDSFRGKFAAQDEDGFWGLQDADDANEVVGNICERPDLVSPDRHSNSETVKGDEIVNEQTASMA